MAYTDFTRLLIKVAIGFTSVLSLAQYVSATPSTMVQQRGLDASSGHQHGVPVVHIERETVTDVSTSGAPTPSSSINTPRPGSNTSHIDLHLFRYSQQKFREIKVAEWFRNATLEVLQQENSPRPVKDPNFPVWFGETFAGVSDFECSTQINGCNTTPQPRIIIAHLQDIGHPADEIEHTAQMVYLTMKWMEKKWNFWAQLEKDLVPMQAHADAELPRIAESFTPHTSRGQSLECVWLRGGFEFLLNSIQTSFSSISRIEDGKFMEPGLFAGLTIRTLAQLTEKSMQVTNEDIAKARREYTANGYIRMPVSWNTGLCAADNGERKDETQGQINAGRESITKQVEKLREGILDFTAALTKGTNATEVVENLYAYMGDLDFGAAVERMGNNETDTDTQMIGLAWDSSQCFNTCQIKHNDHVWAVRKCDPKASHHSTRYCPARDPIIGDTVCQAGCMTKSMAGGNHLVELYGLKKLQDFNLSITDIIRDSCEADLHGSANLSNFKNLPTIGLNGTLPNPLLATCTSDQIEVTDFSGNDGSHNDRRIPFSCGNAYSDKTQAFLDKIGLGQESAAFKSKKQADQIYTSYFPDSVRDFAPYNRFSVFCKAGFHFPHWDQADRKLKYGPDRRCERIEAEMVAAGLKEEERNVKFCDKNYHLAQEVFADEDRNEGAKHRMWIAKGHSNEHRKALEWMDNHRELCRQWMPHHRYPNTERKTQDELPMGNTTTVAST